MKKKFTLLKFLAMIFLISEISIGIGVFSTFFMFPYAAKLVEQRSGNLGIFVNDGTRLPGFIFTNGKSGFSWSSMEDDRTYAVHPEFRFPLQPGRSTFGRITFGRFRTNEDARQLSVAKHDGTFAAIDSLEGSVTFTVTNPEDAAAILAPVKWPFILSFLCTGGSTVAILELLSRMFRKVDAGEIFTRNSIRYVQAIGCLFIASSLLKGFTAAWLKHTMASVVMDHLATGAVYLDSSAKGDSSGFVTGFVVLALAEVFRQGLALKEESALTI